MNLPTMPLLHAALPAVGSITAFVVMIGIGLASGAAAMIGM